MWILILHVSESYMHQRIELGILHCKNIPRWILREMGGVGIAWARGPSFGDQT